MFEIFALKTFQHIQQHEVTPANPEQKICLFTLIFLQ